MSKIIVEVGSTNTKVDYYDGNEIKNLKVINIEFKKNYKINNKLDENDVKKLISEVNSLKDTCDDIYICGTSIFRTLSENEKKHFLQIFKEQTGYEFDIISQEKESELTVIGAARNTNKKVAVMIGGGGSTEIAIYDGKIQEMANSNIGVMDVTEKFPDLAEDVAIIDLEIVKEYVKK